MRTLPRLGPYFSAADRSAIARRIGECLESGQLTLGKYTEQFEREFARRLGVRHAVAVGSGSGSLEILLRVFGVVDRDVLVPTNTFFATAVAVCRAGGRPRFVDLDPRTFAVTVADLEARVSSRTVGVVVVHIGGVMTPELERIRHWCDARGLFLLEDAAHAHGSNLKGREAGTFGAAAGFSFYPTKVMTSGEGGMIVTDDVHVFEESLKYRDQGKESFHSNTHIRMGNNWRMSEPHAIIGLSQLQHLDTFIMARQRVASVYDELLADTPQVTPLRVPEPAASNYYKYIAVLAPGIERLRLKERLAKEYGVSLSGEVYATPCHLQPALSDIADGGRFPAAEDMCARHVCLPISPQMTVEDAAHVVDCFLKVVRDQ